MFILARCRSLKLTSPPRHKRCSPSLKFCSLNVCFFPCVFVLLTEVGKLLVILPEADWVLYSCHRAPSSLPPVSIVLLSCLAAPHFGPDPNPLFHFLRLSSPLPLLLFLFLSLSPSSWFCAHSFSSLSFSLLIPLSVVLFFALHDLPRNIEHVNSVCLKLGFGRRDQRCHNRITVPNHMGPPGTVRHPSLWCVCEEKVSLCVFAETCL